MPRTEVYLNLEWDACFVVTSIPNKISQLTRKVNSKNDGLKSKMVALCVKVKIILRDFREYEFKFVKLPKPSIIFLLGPTASGKTERAMRWAQEKEMEIISVDSAMVYRGMDIGTGKPTLEELMYAPHHLVNIREPDEPYSAADFRTDALKCIAEMIARGKTPLLVGGTMLYVRALLQGLSCLPQANIEVRQRLLEEANKVGWPSMYERLGRVDPLATKRIHPNDPQRIQRALEVYEITGQPMTHLLNLDTCVKPMFDIGQYDIQIFALGREALDPKNRSHLHDRIAERFCHMLEVGLVAEVEGLWQKLRKTGDYKHLASMRAVGYRQVCQYLEGELSYTEMVDKAIAATRQLAKRQLTALRNLKNVKWLTH